MELLDRYLEAVKKHLPWQRQDDILSELRVNLEAQLEDKESELGRPLTQGEAEDWLRQIGPPMLVASRYQPQQYLIGPGIFPIYWFVMRLALFWAFVIYTVLTAVVILSEPLNSTAVMEAVLRIPGVLMVTAAWVTLIFAVVEFVATHFPGLLPAIPGLYGNWSPEALPPVEKGVASGKKPRSFAHAVAEVIFGFICLVWLLLVPEHPYLMFGPGAYYLQLSPFRLAPIWVQFYWWVVGLNVLQLGRYTVDLIRGSWQSSRRGLQIVMSVFGLIPLALLLSVRDHAYVLLKHPEQDQAQYGATLASINQAIAWGFEVICAITVLRLLWEIGRMCVEAYRKRLVKMK